GALAGTMEGPGLLADCSGESGPSFKGQLRHQILNDGKTRFEPGFAPLQPGSDCQNPLQVQLSQRRQPISTLVQETSQAATTLQHQLSVLELALAAKAIHHDCCAN